MAVMMDQEYILQDVQDVAVVMEQEMTTWMGAI
jgi:hypothetical protein